MSATLTQSEKAELTQKRQCLFDLLREDVDDFDLPSPSVRDDRAREKSDQVNDLPEEVVELIRHFASPNDSMAHLLKLR